MTTKPTVKLGESQNTIEMLALRSVVEILVKHYGLHEGKYDLAIEFQMGIGPVGPNPAALLPGAIVAVSKIGLLPALIDGPSVVDASIVNPVKGKAK